MGTFADMPPEKRAECGRMGGIKSGETKRKKKAMRETLEVLLDMPLKAGKRVDVEDVQNFAKLKGKNITMQDAILITMMQNAMRGDVRAAEFVRDTAGQKPKTETELSGSMFVPIIGGDDLLED